MFARQSFLPPAEQWFSTIAVHLSQYISGFHKIAFIWVALWAMMIYVVHWWASVLPRIASYYLEPYRELCCTQGLLQSDQLWYNEEVTVCEVLPCFKNYIHHELWYNEWYAFHLCHFSYILQLSFQRKPNDFSQVTVKVTPIKEHTDAEEWGFAAAQHYAQREMMLETWNSVEEVLTGGDGMDNNFGSQLHGSWPWRGTPGMSTLGWGPLGRP